MIKLKETHGIFTGTLTADKLTRGGMVGVKIHETLNSNIRGSEAFTLTETWSRATARSYLRTMLVQAEQRIKRGQTAMPNPRSGPAGESEKRELILHADNSRGQYDRLINQKKAIILNIKRKLKRGVYDPGKAVRLWQYWIDEAAKDYIREFGRPGQRIDTVFNLATRRAAAAEVAEREIGMIKRGEYSDNPKRKRRASPAQLRARAKFAAMAKARAGKKRRRRNVGGGHAAAAVGHKLLMRRNPRAAGFAVIIRKGGTGARMHFVGGSPPAFSGTGTPKLFRSEAAARRFAQSVAGRFPILGGYHFFAESRARP